MKALMVFLLLAVTMIFSIDPKIIEESIPSYPLISYQTLKQNDGKNGKVWVAVGGFVYDLTESDAWYKGTHMGQHDAGEELTYEILKQSPHGLVKLDGKKIVGILAFTMDDLKKFNEKNGNKAYVAVNGIVYDVTHSKAWRNGEHMGRHSAGSELTHEILKLSPHGLSKLSNVYPVGVLVFTLDDLKKLLRKERKESLRSS
ncbi:cytochrome b5 domain-containing protein [Thermotoga sp. SG1]|uniref:cytochrome b5 domain-containing protein n=1 Tax=Thermotoga sp. SG1 TaxID=126739 RepID=UPI0018EDA48B|nr:cytochrome b5 domain-containing protein [Thermotoga sp. SG1]